LITGATSGIGLAISVVLAQRGVKLYLLGRNFENLKSRLEEPAILQPPVFIHADLGDDKKTEHKIRELTKENTFDFVIHSAGLIHMNLFEDATLEEFDAQYSVNVRAAFHISKLLLPDLKKSKGVIIFLNSTAGLQTWENLSLYASSKHALRALADGLRKEMQEFQVRVTSIYCGSVDTPMQKRVQYYRKNHYDSDIFMDPNHIAGLILHILQLPPELTIADMTVLGNKKR